MSATRASILSMLVAVAGCSDTFDHVLLVPEGGEPEGAQISASSVRVPLGATFVVDATAMDASGPLVGDFSFNLVSADETILGVQPVAGRDPGTPSFVFFGASEGETHIDVLVDGSPKTPIPATVAP